MVNVFLKKVDKEIYLALKSEAAKRGKTIGEMFNEAVKVWLTHYRHADPERELNMKVYDKIKGEISNRSGEYFVIAGGSFIGRFKTLREAARNMKLKGSLKGFIIRAQPGGEWLGGSLES